MIPQWSIINRPFTVIAANGFMHRRESANGNVWLRISLSGVNYSRDSRVGKTMGNDRISSNDGFVRFMCVIFCRGILAYIGRNTIILGLRPS